MPNSSSALASTASMRSRCSAPSTSPRWTESVSLSSSPFQFASAVARLAELPLAQALGPFGREALLVGPQQRDLHVREQLPGAVGHRAGHLRLVPQPRPAPFGAGPGLAFRPGRAVEGIGSSGQPLDPLLMGAQLQPRLHLGLPRVGPVGREPVPPGAVGLLLHRQFLGRREPFRALLHVGQRLLQRVLGLGRGGGAALGFACGPLRLPGEPPELLRDSRRGPAPRRGGARRAPRPGLPRPAAGTGRRPGPRRVPCTARPARSAPPPPRRRRPAPRSGWAPRRSHRARGAPRARLRRGSRPPPRAAPRRVPRPRRACRP